MTTVVISDTMILRKFFFGPGEKAATIAAELKALSAEEKAELAELARPYVTA